MIAFWVKALVAGLIVALATTVARRVPSLGALIVSLPIVSIISMIVLRREGAHDAEIASYVQATFWFFLPSMPMFLLIPALLRSGTGFWPSLLIGCATTVVLYLLFRLAAARFGLAL